MCVTFWYGQYYFDFVIHFFCMSNDGFCFIISCSPFESFSVWLETCSRSRAVRFVMQIVKIFKRSIPIVFLWLMWKSHDLSAYCEYLSVFFFWLNLCWSAMIDTFFISISDEIENFCGDKLIMFFSSLRFNTQQHLLWIYAYFILNTNELGAWISYKLKQKLFNIFRWTLGTRTFFTN